MTPAQLLEIAIAAAQASGAVLAQKLTESRTIGFKGGSRSDLVTDADQAAELAALAILKARAPDHGVLAEESGASNLNQRFLWFIDPLDGTTNYAHGIPHYCTTLGVEETASHTLLAGVVFDPVRNELFTAARGEGAFLNGNRIHCSKTSTLDTSVLSTGFPYDLKQNPQAPLGLFNHIIQKARGIRRMGSAALDLAYVAAGRFDGYFEFGLKPWDVAAGALLIEEAGGQVRRIDGAPFEARVGDMLAAAPGIFEPLASECADFVRSFGWKPRS
jgi:myo-inositol-1(or 4)-monophosphatase